MQYQSHGLLSAHCRVTASSAAAGKHRLFCIAGPVQRSTRASGETHWATHAAVSSYVPVDQVDLSCICDHDHGVVGVLALWVLLTTAGAGTHAACDTLTQCTTWRSSRVHELALVIDVMDVFSCSHCMYGLQQCAYHKRLDKRDRHGI